MTIPWELLQSERLVQFTKFCLVGGSGLLVDMGILYLLADPAMLGWNVTLSKVLAAEAALTSNFTWNELWTFRRTGEMKRREGRLFGRFLKFNAICGIGILWAVLLLHFFYSGLNLNLYLSNFFAIVLVTCWNFGMNKRFTWGKTK
jgi:dolichol-phosphate mannosyltransferase